MGKFWSWLMDDESEVSYEEVPTEFGTAIRYKTSTMKRPIQMNIPKQVNTNTKLLR